MVTSQKSTASVASPNAKPNQPAAHSTPCSGGSDSNCFVHRLEEALKLVESLQLTNEQKTKIAQFTKEQTARCSEEKKQHKATHAQILALLTPDQQKTLQAVADDSAHCHQGQHAEQAVHA